MTTADLMQRLFEHLERLGKPLRVHSRPGLPPERVREAVEGIGLEANQELVDLYGFRNGASGADGVILDAVGLFPGHYWLTLDEAVETWEAISDDDRWRTAWFPIFATGEGDFYAVVLDPESPSYGAVVGFLLGDDEQLVEYRSLTDMLSTLDRAYAAGLFTLEDGALEGDFETLGAFAHEVQGGFQPYPFES